MFEYVLEYLDFLFFIYIYSGVYGIIIMVFTAAEKEKLKRIPFTIKYIQLCVWRLISVVFLQMRFSSFYLYAK